MCELRSGGGHRRIRGRKINSTHLKSIVKRDKGKRERQVVGRKTESKFLPQN